MRAIIAERLSRWLSQSLAQWPGELPEERRREYTKLIDGTGDLLGHGTTIWRSLPGLIRDLFGSRGWKWNGFYVRRENELRLAEGAAGPPVCLCLPLRENEAVGSSGSCWDAMLMNQTIALDDVKQWPGYRSCDHESNLNTKSGIVCPIRRGNGCPIAVWDLDSEAELAPEDAVFMGRFFDTLSALLDPDETDFT